MEHYWAKYPYADESANHSEVGRNFKNFHPFKFKQDIDEKNVPQATDYGDELYSNSEESFKNCILLSKPLLIMIQAEILKLIFNLNLKSISLTIT